MIEATRDRDAVADELGLAGIFDADSSDDEEDAERVVTYVRTHTKQTPRELSLHLTSSHHSLWGHLLWNAR